jgi:cell wall-associated protease
MYIIRIFGSAIFSFSLLFGFSQSTVSISENDPSSFQGWHLKDKTADGLQGISLNQAYDFLKGKKSIPVIVAVIDSGIDTLHEDLKPVLWRNPKEIPGNGKDDDKNGYTDDVHGWNFLGGKDGKNVNEDSYEAARIYHQLKTKYKDVSDESAIIKEDLSEYRMFVKAKDNLESGATEAIGNLLFLRNIYNKSNVADSMLRLVFKPSYNGNDLTSFKPANSKETDAKAVMLALYKGFDMMEANNITLMKEFSDYFKGQERKAEALDTPPPAYRQDVVKDNYADFNDRFYGNNDIMAEHSSHGTHVSGIIAAARNNRTGMDGVADNVRIMVLRAVPDGDEHDKDIALAIRYAVDHGAKVINMSFGKSFSPQKKWVDEAVRYAQSRDVLLVHAAGNDGKNIDSTDNFPNAEFADTNLSAPNFITVGASGDVETGGLAADFSNYGKSKVDVFAPGVKIYSSIPGGNTYGFQQGTSMASPVVAGIAALLRSYYPQLTAEQIKYCIETGIAKIEDKVKKPGSEDEDFFASLSRTGGIVNAYGAVRIAETITPVKKGK